MSAAEVMLSVVAPTIGLCCANVMFLSPMPAVLSARKAKDLKDLNPLPFPMIMANCALWIVYSGLLRDYFVFFSNLPGMLLGIFFTLSALRVGSDQQRQQIEMIVLVTIGCATFAVVFGGALINTEKSVMVSVVGYSANIVLFFFYSAPLSVMASVLKNRCARELYWPLSLLSTVNGLSWTVYGAALGDMFIAVPNGVGCVLGIVQLVLIAIFHEGRHKDDKAGAQQVQSMDSTEIEAAQNGTQRFDISTSD